MSGHGHVIPNKNGTVARCGGPALCSECAQELASAKQGYSKPSTINDEWKSVAEEFGIKIKIKEDFQILTVYGPGIQNIRAMAEEISRLRRIIAKELTENDELGSEFVYVNALKSDSERLRTDCSLLRATLAQVTKERDEWKSHYDKLLGTHLTSLKELQPDGPVWRRLAGYQNELGKLRKELAQSKAANAKLKDALTKITQMGGCLCGHFEFCESCSSDSYINQARNMAKEALRDE